MPCNQACHIHTWLVIELVKLMTSLQISVISHSQDHTQDVQGSFRHKKSTKSTKFILPFKSNVATVHAYPQKYCHPSLPVIVACHHCPLSLPITAAHCCCLLLLDWLWSGLRTFWTGFGPEPDLRFRSGFTHLGGLNLTWGSRFNKLGKPGPEVQTRT
jgi:hypothetical protein